MGLILRVLSFFFSYITLHTKITYATYSANITNSLTMLPKLTILTFKIYEYLTLLSCRMLATVGSFLAFKKWKTCTVFLSSYTNTSGSLGEREMLWEHESQTSVSTAFLSSPKLSLAFV